VFTYKGPTVEVVDSGGNTRSVKAESDFDSNVGFTIMIP